MRNKTFQKIDGTLDVDSSDLVSPDEDSNLQEETALTKTESSENVIATQDNSTREEHKNEDYRYARNTMKNLMEDGQQAISELMGEIQEGGNTPRHYEVASTLMKNVSEISKDLVELQKQMNEIEKNDGQKAETINNVQNNYYKTTQEIIEEMREEEEKTDDGSTN